VLTEIVELGERHFEVETMETRLFSFARPDDSWDPARSTDGPPWPHLLFGDSRMSFSLQVRLQPGFADNLRLLRSDWWLRT